MGFRVFIHEDINKMTGHSPVQAAPADPALRRNIRLDGLLRILATCVTSFQNAGKLTYAGLVCSVGE